MMGTETHWQEKAEHDGMIQSSIALLQERFQQVQRVKEMREKREKLVGIMMPHDNCRNITCATSVCSANPTPTSNYNSSPTDSTLLFTHIYESPSSPDHNNLKSNPPSLHYINDHHHHHNELRAFIPLTCDFNCNTHHKPSGGYSSSSSILESAHHTYHHHHHHHHPRPDEVSLSLWPSTSNPCNEINHNNATISTESDSEMTISTAFDFDHSHFSEVDTTLHL